MNIDRLRLGWIRRVNDPNTRKERGRLEHPFAPAYATHSSPCVGADCRKSKGAAVVLFIILGGVWASTVIRCYSVGDQPDTLIDPWSESDAIRSAEAYAVEGFTLFAGLPRVAYGDQFANYGTLDEINRGLHGLRGLRPGFTVEMRNQMPYTHYPPGPNWLCGISRLIFGKGHVRFFRILPLIVGLIGLIAFGHILCGAIGSHRALVMVLGCATFPMLSNMTGHLHCHGYALSFLLIELALLTMGLANSQFGGQLWLPILGGLGFIQGWISFDYAFIVIFAPAAVLTVFLEGPRDRRIRLAALATTALGAGFTLSHLVHFGEVAVYYGSIAHAIDDFAASASYRGGATGIDRLSLWRSYLTLLGGPNFFGPMAVLPIALLAVHLVAGRGSMEITWPVPVRVLWEFEPRRYFVVLLAALMVCSIWIVLMPNHAAEHRFFLPRHFFLLYYVVLLTAIYRMRSPCGQWETPSSSLVPIHEHA